MGGRWKSFVGRVRPLSCHGGVDQNQGMLYLGHFQFRWSMVATQLKMVVAFCPLCYGKLSSLVLGIPHIQLSGPEPFAASAKDRGGCCSVSASSCDTRLEVKPICFRRLRTEPVGFNSGNGTRPAAAWPPVEMVRPFFWLGHWGCRRFLSSLFAAAEAIHIPSKRNRD